MPLAPAWAGAQTAPDSGTFVLRHGRDTVATEQFSRSDTKLEGTLTLRNAKRTSQRWTTVVAPDATLPLIEVTVREGSVSGGRAARVAQRARVSADTSQVALFNLGGGQTLTARVSRLGTDSLRLAIGNVEYHLRVDQAGRVLGGKIPAQRVIVERR